MTGNSLAGRDRDLHYEETVTVFKLKLLYSQGESLLNVLNTVNY